LMELTGFNWLRIGSSGGLLWTRWWTFGFHTKVGYFLISWVTMSFSNNILHCGVSESECYCCCYSAKTILEDIQQTAGTSKIYIYPSGTEVSVNW
jgi:hypothetical protein